jgi:hypothetical protein
MHRVSLLPRADTSSELGCPLESQGFTEGQHLNRKCESRIRKSSRKDESIGEGVNGAVMGGNGSGALSNRSLMAIK